MKIKIILLFLFFISIISYAFSKESNNDELKEKLFIKKIKNIIIIFFNILEHYTLYFISILNEREIKEPYDFVCFFIFGCIFRIIFLFIKNIYKSIFKLNDNYVYNQPDNTESLYIVQKRLDELSNNLNSITDKKGEGNNNNINNDNNLNENDILKLGEINSKNKAVNKRLIELENYIKIIEKNYKEEKKNNENILSAIKESQQIIKDSLKKEKTEDK